MPFGIVAQTERTELNTVPCVAVKTRYACAPCPASDPRGSFRRGYSITVEFDVENDSAHREFVESYLSHMDGLTQSIAPAGISDVAVAGRKEVQAADRSVVHPGYGLQYRIYLGPDGKILADPSKVHMTLWCQEDRKPPTYDRDGNLKEYEKIPRGATVAVAFSNRATIRDSARGRLAVAGNRLLAIQVIEVPEVPLELVPQVRHRFPGRDVHGVVRRPVPVVRPRPFPQGKPAQDDAVTPEQRRQRLLDLLDRMKSLRERLRALIAAFRKAKREEEAREAERKLAEVEEKIGRVNGAVVRGDGFRDEHRMSFSSTSSAEREVAAMERKQTSPPAGRAALWRHKMSSWSMER